MLFLCQTSATVGGSSYQLKWQTEKHTESDVYRQQAKHSVSVSEPLHQHLLLRIEGKMVLPSKIRRKSEVNTVLCLHCFKTKLKPYS